MDFDGRAVQRDGFDLNPGDSQSLHLLENTVQNAPFGPAIHARVDRVPVAVMRRQGAPFASLLGHVKDRVEHLEIGQADIAPLLRQARGNQFELFGSDLHHAQRMHPNPQKVKI
jgi:hypothetical protein